MHGRLANAVDNAEARGRHLALAAAGRDEAAAAAAHAAAAEAAARGAPDAAAELVELALALTEPGSDAEPPRLLDAASYLHWAGETKRARNLLEAVDSWPRWPPELQARGLDLLGELVSYTDGPPALAAFGERLVEESRPLEVQATGHLIISQAAMQVDAETALAHAETALALLDELGDHADPGSVASALTVRVRAGAVLGHGLDRGLMDRALDDLDASRDLLERLVREATAKGHETSRAVGLVHLAVTECLAGDLRLASEHAAAARSISTEFDVAHLSILAMHSLAFSSAWLGDVGEARHLCELARPSAAGLPGAVIDLDAALAACERALEHHEELPMPLERARTLLVRGVIERRARRRGKAKESFGQALAVFDAAGARLWAERARVEIDRVGLRRGSGGELTENERRVAELAASGMTNHEVAAALFMSPKTVAANLSRVYQKLDIRSRAELGARMAERVQT